MLADHFLHFLTLVIFVNGQGSIDLPTYKDHPCNRVCEDGAPPMTCEYNFTIEYYYVLSKACYNCPLNLSDCERPHCVPADGVSRPIMTVNRMVPGPAIQVCLKDMIKINVHNSLAGWEATVIHWHGLYMKGFQHFDGAAMITQCPIPPLSSFQYRFEANNRGTLYWHSHAGFQRSDGVAGAFIVREPLNRDPSSHLYDHDLPEHVMVLQDWSSAMISKEFVDLFHAGKRSKLSMLINGRGSFQEFKDPDTNETVYTPHSVFRVAKDKKYRFRVISNGVYKCPIQFSVDGHELTMIASDGVPFEPVVVSSFMMFTGERFDFVLDADQDVGNYWIRTIGFGDCAKSQARQVAILRYTTASATNPTGPTDYESGKRAGKLLNPFNQKGSATATPVSWLNTTSADPSNVKAVPDKQFHLALDFHLINNYKNHDKNFYPIDAVDESLRLVTPQVNYINNRLPASPLLSQFNEVPMDTVCNDGNTRNCSQEYCECLHLLKVDLGDLVEVVLVDEGILYNTNHPMHLHGYNFRVVAMDKVGDSVTMDTVKEMDANGLITRNLDTPIAKDSVTVPDGGYTIIRFVADNPGFWLLHCHVQSHTTLEMSVIFQVGTIFQHPQPPPNFPKCGNWNYQEEDKSTASKHVLAYTAIVLSIFMFTHNFIQLTCL